MKYEQIFFHLFVCICSFTLCLALLDQLIVVCGVLQGCRVTCLEQTVQSRLYFPNLWVVLHYRVIILFYTTGHWLPPSPEKMESRHGIMKAFPKVKRAKGLQGKDAPPLKKIADECDVTGGYCVCMHVSTLQKECIRVLH